MKPISLLMMSIYICTILGLSSGCKHDDSAVTFSRSDLPAYSIGNWWRYRVMDSLTGTIDTLTLTVSWAGTSGGTQTFTGLISRAGTVVDTAHIALSDTAFIFAPNHGGHNPSALVYYTLKLPFTINTTWQYGGSLGPVKVTGLKGPYTVLGHGYNAFTLSLQYSYPDAALDEGYAVAKDIGLVDLGYDMDDFVGLHKRSQQLIDYHIQ